MSLKNGFPSPHVWSSTCDAQTYTRAHVSRFGIELSSAETEAEAATEVTLFFSSASPAPTMTLRFEPFSGAKLKNHSSIKSLISETIIAAHHSIEHRPSSRRETNAHRLAPLLRPAAQLSTREALFWLRRQQINVIGFLWSPRRESNGMDPRRPLRPPLE